ncbi:MAG: PilZ domain-containing protein [bacterium]|nr:PilZ domain-containing protein [bacterium]MBU1916894.1 PilZ domain-containing protein [bacterium]
MINPFPKRPEKRNYQRLELELPVRLELDGKEIETSTENISCGGMFLPMNSKKSLTELRETKELTAFITIPDECRSIKLTGNVNRVQRNTERTPIGVAIEFCGLFDENHLEISRYLKTKLTN